MKVNILMAGGCGERVELIALQALLVQVVDAQAETYKCHTDS
jgi:hypothetical protein